MFLLNVNKIGWTDAIISDRWIYYNSKDDIWKYDLKTFLTSKIISLPGVNFRLSKWAYNDNFVSYVRTQIKTNMVMVDSVFIN